MIHRREFLSGLAASPCVGFSQAKAAGSSLRDIAAAKHMLYGCAVTADHLKSDPDFAGLVGREASILVPEAELKRDVVQAVKGRFDFRKADAIAAFAKRNGLQMRGHTLVWYAALPPWLEHELQEKTPRQELLTDMIVECGRHYGSQLHSWDVINEVVAPEEGHPAGLRKRSPWYKAFGETYMATAFHAAREAFPEGLLFYGDYNVEMATPEHDLRRKAVLGVLEKLKKQNVPIDAFGVQGHIKPFREPFDEMVYAKFLDEIRDMGLKVMVTEFDVADKGGPADPARRDADVASATRRFLDVTLANSACLGVLTWGISDRYSWLSFYPDYKWPDGQLSRGLPYDSGLRPKAMREAVAKSFASANRV